MSDLNDDQIDALLEEVSAVDVPEPSPLFWSQFAARVNAAIDGPPPRAWWQMPAVWAWTSVAALILVSVLGFYVIRPALQRQLPAITTMPTPGTGTAANGLDAADVDVDIESDEAWAVVRSFADELRYEDARDAGVVPRPGAIERAATELTAEERAELVRIIQDELKRTGA
jgi:hypothetical protein